MESTLLHAIQYDNLDDIKNILQQNFSRKTSEDNLDDINFASNSDIFKIFNYTFERKDAFLVLKMLIEFKFDINCRDYDLTTPLMIAPNLECVKLLVENRANLNARDEWLSTVFDYHNSSPEILAYLRKISTTDNFF